MNSMEAIINKGIQTEEEDKERKISSLKITIDQITSNRVKKTVEGVSKEEIIVPTEDAPAFAEIKDTIETSKLIWKEETNGQQRHFHMATKKWIEEQLIQEGISKKEIDKKMDLVFDNESKRKWYFIRVGYPFLDEEHLKLEYYYVVNPYAYTTQQNINEGERLEETEQPELPGF